MLIDIILIIILVGAIGGIIFISIKKFPLIAMINVEALQQEQAERKKELIRQRFRREIILFKEKVKYFFQQIIYQIKNLFNINKSS